MRIAILYVAAFVSGMILGTVSSGASPGQEAFEKRCGGCHGVDSAKEGPPLRGVFGRAAGKRRGFPYSDGLRAAKFRWDAAMLDRWLTDPDAVIAGTDMAFRLDDQAERQKIIEFLRQLK